MMLYLALLGCAAPLLHAQTDAGPVPAWLFPVDAPMASQAAAVIEEGTLIHLPHSRAAFTPAQLNDLFFAPDWYPQAHDALPEIVAHGRAPDVYACGYCHSPSGQGRPENAALAGLPVEYIEQQMADFKSGARRRLWKDDYPPSDLMIHVAAFVTPQETASAAQYFAKQRLLPRVRVMERTWVPRARVVGLVYAASASGGQEALGERLLEFSPDPVAHESRDETMRYQAYVPVGSIGRGRRLAVGATPADSAAGERNAACVTCHGRGLRGIGVVPSLAGHSPSYLLRQLLAFKTGARAGAASAPMRSVAVNLELRDMIAVAAYAASLPPTVPPD